MFRKQWIFGRNCEVFTYAVPERTKETLIETIEACVEK